MKKLLAGVALIAAAGSVQALPNLQQVSGIAGTSGYYDTDSESATLNHITDGDATAFLFLEAAGQFDTNTFGIYEFTDIAGVINVTDTLEVFGGTDSPLSSGTIHFDLVSGVASFDDGTTVDTANIDDTFGFYLGTVNGTFYSHSSLNTGGLDHVLTFDTSDNSVGDLLGSDLVLGWEDVSGGDNDYDDMVVGVSDVNVPEPASLALMSLGLLGFGAARRRKS